MSLKTDLMPADLKKLWDPVKQQVWSVHAHWGLLIQLFGKSRERTELFNKTAAALFRLTQDALVNEVQLALCKLAESSRKRLTLHALLTEFNRRSSIVAKKNLLSFTSNIWLSART